jgi:protein MpaA
LVLGTFAPVPSADAAEPPAIDGPAAGTARAKRLNVGDVVVFGRSVQGRDLIAYRLGTPGGRVVLIVGNVHGDEPKGVDITRALRMSAVPAGIDLFVVDTINPDGLAASTRQNANGVDLNRNFSYDWGYIPRSTTNGQFSGEAPADQPEALALQNLVALIAPEITVFYHQDANRVSLAGSRRQIPQNYARLVGQSTGSTPCTQGCTGTAGSFVNHRLPNGTAFLVELPNSRVVTAEMIRRHVAALLTVMVM